MSSPLTLLLLLVRILLLSSRFFFFNWVFFFTWVHIFWFFIGVRFCFFFTIFQGLFFFFTRVRLLYFLNFFFKKFYLHHMLRFFLSRLFCLSHFIFAAIVKDKPIIHYIHESRERRHYLRSTWQDTTLPHWNKWTNLPRLFFPHFSAFPNSPCFVSFLFPWFNL